MSDAAKSSLLGAILVRTANLSLQALQAALDRQRAGQESVKLGQILLEMELITEEELERALALQRRLHEERATEV
jgi:hypothetical protein